MGEAHQVQALARARDRREEVLARCPFCREDLRLEDGAWTACALCLARHHAGCWEELGRCASCGEAARLSPTAPPPERIPGLLGWAARGLELANRLLGILIGGAGVSVSMLGLWALLAISLDPPQPGQPGRLAVAAVLGAGLALVAVGLALRAAALRWAARSRELPLLLWATLALVVALAPATVGWMLDAEGGLVAGLLLPGAVWTLLVVGVSVLGARCLRASPDGARVRSLVPGTFSS